MGLPPGTKEYSDNYRSFVSVMDQIGDISLCWEIVLQFESRLKQGEGKTMKNRAAVLMSCLKKVLALKPR